MEVNSDKPGQPSGEGNPFQVLGLEVRYGLGKKELESRWKELSKAFHPDRHNQESAQARRLALSRAVSINEAYRALRDDLTRASVILNLRGGAPAAADNTLLMEVMELREALLEAKSAKDLPQIERLAAQVLLDADATKDALGASLDGPEVNLGVAEEALGRLRYLRRFLDEVELARDALAP